MLTSKGSKDDIISGLSAGADDYLTKPTHYAELVARIKTGIRILELEKSLKAAADEIHLLSMTASFGVTGFSPRDWKEGVKPEALLQLADILLYEAKEAGRDQVKGRLLPVL